LQGHGKILHEKNITVRKNVAVRKKIMISPQIVVQYRMKQTVVGLGIVLRSDPHRDFDLCVRILTQRGVMVCYAIGARKPTARLRGALQPFTIAEFTTVGTRITGAHAIAIPTNIARDINRYYLACSLVTVLLSIRDHNAQIFYLTAKTIESLNSTTSCYKIFINFYLKLLLLLGLDIEATQENSPSFMKGCPDRGGVVSTLNQFKTTDNDELDTIDLPLSTAKTLVRLIAEHYVTHLDIVIPNTKNYE